MSVSICAPRIKKSIILEYWETGRKSHSYTSLSWCGRGKKHKTSSLATRVMHICVLPKPLRNVHKPQHPTCWEVLFRTMALQCSCCWCNFHRPTTQLPPTCLVLVQKSCRIILVGCHLWPSRQQCLPEWPTILDCWLPRISLYLSPPIVVNMKICWFKFTRNRKQPNKCSLAFFHECISLSTCRH